MFQSYIHENLLKIQTLVHKILCRQENDADADADANTDSNVNRIHTKIDMSTSP